MLSFLRRFFYKLKKNRYKDITPEEIFLDSKNLPDFDIYQFEGRLEKPIPSRVFLIFSFVSFFIIIIFLYKLWDLQIINGHIYKDKSENNKLKQTLIVAPRGNIYSRDGVELVRNKKADAETDFPKRVYIDDSGFSHLLGFVKYPAKDKYGFYYEEDFLPKDGVELYLNEMLSGKNGVKLEEISVDGIVVSQSVIESPKNGEDAVLSIDSRIQSKFYKIIEDLAGSVGFQGGAGIIMSVDSGEILSIVSYPEYKSQTMAEGVDINQIQKYFQDSRNPFLDRVISGLYTPGSIIKPFVAFAALEEKIISPNKEIVSTGKIEIPNPYDPSKPSIFRDWKAHGAVDMRRAIAVSSDVYFYEIGGGFGNQKGLGIAKIKQYLETFGFTKKTGFDSKKEEIGVIPDPKWKAKNFNGEPWRVGDTYNTSIGQYGMQMTPIQAVRATAAIANGGKLLTPSILFTSTSTVANGEKIKNNPENLKIVKEGMRDAVLSGGTAVGLNTPAVEIAGKTGTAELGARKQFVNSWIIGFFPYQNPKYAFTVVMERGPVTNLIGATYVMRQLIDWMTINTPEYLKNQ